MSILDQVRSAIQSAGSASDAEAAVAESVSLGSIFFEDIKKMLRSKLAEKFSGDPFIVATSADQVIFGLYPTDPVLEPDGKLWRQDYAVDGSRIEFVGDKVEVAEQRDFVPVIAASDAFTVTEVIRLSNNGAAELPLWQQVHEVGEYAITHSSGSKIELTPELATRMIQNFHSGAIGRRVPLDAGHTTAKGGPAFGWAVNLRLGNRHEGLPGTPEPSGSGNIVYAKFRYTELGKKSLLDEEYSYLSPEYALDFPDRKTGARVGPALLAVGAHNDPFLMNLRTIQGEEPVSLGRIVLPSPHREAPAPKAKEDPVSGDTVTLAKLQEQNTQLAQELARMKQVAHSTKVEALLKDYSSKGVPPAVVACARALLLNFAEESQELISLSIGETEEKLNGYALVKRLLDEVGALKLGRSSRAGEDTRPNGTSLGLRDGVLDTQVRDGVIKDLLSMAGVKNGAGPVDMDGGE